MALGSRSQTDDDSLRESLQEDLGVSAGAECAVDDDGTAGTGALDSGADQPNHAVPHHGDVAELTTDPAGRF
jgi:hypothetical protein